jgi:serine/threonine protein kinase/photosystem II stability/assembly factor-like uncharacterized protein
MAKVASNLCGTVLGKYEIQAEIGRGGMGVVYRGYDPALDRYVAIKVLAPHLVWETEFVQRFLREARAAARLKHASIVTIHDVGQAEGCYYFVMEHLEGSTLTEIIRQRGPLPPDEALSILRPLADALDYACRRGLVHRDIKPGNVIVDLAGHVTLTDFGIARAVRETRLTTTGTIVGTPEYMSPEQAQGLTADARSDQYSLAIVAYEMLSGRVPFEADSTLALLHMIVYNPLPPIRQANPNLPVGVEGVLKKALAKDPGDRYEKTTTFVEALGQALAGEEIVKTPTLAMEPQPATTSPPTPDRTKVMPQAPPPAATPMPEPIYVAAPAPEPERAKVVSDAQPIVSARRRIPVWAWALGGLVILALVLAVVMGEERGATPMSTTETATVLATSTLRLEPTSAAISPAASSLGPYLVFVSDRDGKREVYHLTAAGEVARITRTPDDGESWAPALMPDGAVLFTSDRDGKREIYHLTATGEVVPITHTPGDGESWVPALTPDGTVLFTSDRDGKREIYHLTAAGEVVRITRTPDDGESWAPVSMPDGTLLFTSDRDGKREVYHLTAAGEVVPVTHTPGDGESWAPVSTPDGTLLFTSDRDGKREIYRLAETGEAIRVTETLGRGESWIPDR